jgi:hypothetical protein
VRAKRRNASARPAAQLLRKIFTTSGRDWARGEIQYDSLRRMALLCHGSQHVASAILIAAKVIALRDRAFRPKLSEPPRSSEV